MKEATQSVFKRFRKGIQQFSRWFLPGLGIKRWMVMIMLGITMMGVGLAVLLLNIYRTDTNNSAILVFLSYVSLRFLPRIVRVFIFGSLGIGLVIYGIWGLNRALLRPFLRPGRAVVDQLADYRRRERGPRVVAIGGGHGLSTLLRGLKAHTRNLTAVVTVADDGGSSGRLRESLGILPPGDIRNCLAALSNDEALLTQLFQYRFSGAPELEGHSFGNLFISALTEITGSFEEAIAESGRALSVSGRVLPSTLHDVRLVADVRLPHVVNEIRVAGESKIPEMAGRVRRVWLEPNNPPAFPPVLQSILGADLIVIGPGSLYTSLLPNLLVPDLLAAIHASRAIKVFVCNIATQAGETDSYSCYDHARAVEEHIGEDLFDVVLCNENYEGDPGDNSQWVRADEKTMTDSRSYCADLIDDEHPWRHNSVKLAQVLMDLFFERTGPLSN
ncbi:MAG: uridine diphosphate-N-acetylglucosamine-binding protein YvcK [Chloroflexi bacterium]|nr:uridine diphosphate-N-acetylglucosamine-binding protein YvcK [Chloroflexota bacterium]MBI3341479.1 uridine diphosphate-N-acetylglucosamine-binding protein YvcK [Chloroflexota bacterium]